MSRWFAPSPRQDKDAEFGSDPPAAAGPRSTRRQLLGVAVAGCVAGFLIGYFSSWADTSPEAAVPDWEARLPKLPADVEPSYGALFDESGRIVMDALADHPDSPDAVSALALLHYLAHDRLGEQTCWERCLLLDKQNSLAHSRLVSLAQQNADYDRIIDLMQEALASDPQNSTYRGMLGSALLHLNRYDEAGQQLERATRSRNANAETYLLLGEVYNQVGDYAKARRALETAVALDPLRMDACYSLAMVCTKLGQDEEATRYREQFAKLKAEQREVDTGTENFRDEIRDAQFMPVRVSEILTYAGKAYLAHDDAQHAEGCFLKAAEVSPKDVDCRKLLSEIARMQGRFEDSLRWVKELKQIQPKNNLHYRNEGLLYIRLGRLTDAERVFQDICVLEPARAFGYAALADLYLQAGRNLAQARSLAERAVDLEPSAGHWRLLAAIAQKSGDNATARTAIEQARIVESSPPENQSSDMSSAGRE